MTMGLERQEWTCFALKEFQVYHVSIHMSQKAYSSITTWSVDVLKDGNTISFHYDSCKLEKDFKINQYGFEDLSLMS